MLLEPMFLRSPIRNLAAMEPVNLGKLMTAGRDWTAKQPPAMSDWRRNWGAVTEGAPFRHPQGRELAQRAPRTCRPLCGRLSVPVDRRRQGGRCSQMRRRVRHTAWERGPQTGEL